jgi:hypothetical protein
MKRIAIVLAVIFLLVSAVQVWAFDGQRKGFILGGGLGLGMTSYKFESGPFQTDTENQFSFMTEFKIGYAPTEQVEVFYASKVSWFNDALDNVIVANGLGLAAVSYYFLPQTPTWFVTGGLGFSTASAPFEESSRTYVGFGVSVGGGYEFARHFAVEFDLMYSAPEDEGVTFKGFVPRVVVTATAF